MEKSIQPLRMHLTMLKTLLVDTKTNTMKKRLLEQSRGTEKHEKPDERVMSGCCFKMRVLITFDSSVKAGRTVPYEIQAPLIPD